MTIRLRPHHFLCLLTYAGKGYSAAFVANYDAISARIGRGEALEIVEGPDDICAPLLLDSEPHCWRDSVLERDRQAIADLLELNVAIRTGERITLDAEALARMRTGFARGPTRSACTGCQWHELCSSIAAADFKGTRVQMGPPS
tara:strand:+ start:827 stop:1258 length:432 start_codon:yes stop_codon:yes gene_type:complete